MKFGSDSEAETEMSDGEKPGRKAMKRKGKRKGGRKHRGRK